jgi:hypothetical protein
MRKAPLTVYDRTAAEARGDQLRVREVQRRRRELDLDSLHRLLSDLDLAVTAVARAVPDGQLCTERLREAVVCKEQLDRLWERTLAAGRRQAGRASRHVSSPPNDHVSRWLAHGPYRPRFPHSDQRSLTTWTRPPSEWTAVTVKGVSA